MNQILDFAAPNAASDATNFDRGMTTEVRWYWMQRWELQKISPVFKLFLASCQLDWMTENIQVLRGYINSQQ